MASHPSFLGLRDCPGGGTLSANAGTVVRSPYLSIHHLMLLISCRISPTCPPTPSFLLSALPHFTDQSPHTLQPVLTTSSQRWFLKSHLITSNLCFKTPERLPTACRKRTHIPSTAREVCGHAPVCAGSPSRHPLPRHSPQPPWPPLVFFFFLHPLVVIFMCQLGKAVVLGYLVRTRADITVKEFP